MITEKDKLVIAETERWLDSDEYRRARGDWLNSEECKNGARFEDSSFFRDARLAYRERVSGN